MTETGRGQGPVVVGTDGSETALRGVQWAARAAAVRRAPLQILHASGYPERYTGESMLPPESFKAELRRQRWEFLHAARQSAIDTVAASGLPRLDVETVLDPEQPIPALVQASASARLLVLGTSAHRSITGLIVGSTTIALVGHAHSPVVSVRGDVGDTGEPDRRPVVVGVDGSPLSERALGCAFDEASFRSVALVAVHTWSDSDTSAFRETHVDWEPLRDTEERRLAERLAGWRERYPDVPVERVLVKDKPRHELLEWSQRAQLVVVGSRGRGGFRGLLLGSTSHALIHNAGCPVLVARPEDG
ncbi:universal stress protein [Prauserella alba]|uniref:Universal stress protein n=1 Tax=Prauserella alba TaxID=176898 RepID=A0ABN1V4N9_9PSEU|nr:universal stress protein [Prauserella alba]MCP2180107.1 Nucleotide-binding universal stress protein, UspA family [Prauserella alba]